MVMRRRREPESAYKAGDKVRVIDRVHNPDYWNYRPGCTGIVERVYISKFDDVYYIGIWVTLDDDAWIDPPLRAGKPIQFGEKDIEPWDPKTW